LQGNILDEYWTLKKKYNFNKIVSNIPYNISEPLMKEIFKDELELVVLTVGEKFSKILSEKNNRVGIIANELFNVQVLKSVSPSAFNPRPKVDSAIVRLVPKSKEKLNQSIYAKLAKLDKLKLRNVIIRILEGKKTKTEIRELTDNLLFEKTLYQLSNKEFIELDNLISTLK
jgi:16S rRNA (adenine1518-N6/adenine1519-N6)-dimethyltransferase